MAQEVDWAAVEADYRAGIKTKRLIAKEHGIHEHTLSKKAKKEGWKADLRGAVREEFEDRIISSSVPDSGTKTAEQIALEYATTQVEVIKNHRKWIRDANSKVVSLFGELNSCIESRAALQLQIEDDINLSGKEYTIPDKMNFHARRSNDLYQHASIAEKLVNCLNKLVSLERQAFDIDGSSGGDGDASTPVLDTLMSELAGRRRRLDATEIQDDGE